MKKSLAALVLGISLAAFAGAAQASGTKDAAQLRIPEKVDLNNDGKVSLAEHLAWEKGLFITNDLDGDGYITPKEISQRAMERYTKMRESGALQVDDEKFAAMTSAQYVLAPDLDTDGDGRISLDEHLSYETSHFRSNDLDNDGQVTMEEIVLKQTKMAAERLRRMQAQEELQEHAGQPNQPVRQETVRLGPGGNYQE